MREILLHERSSSVRLGTRFRFSILRIAIRGMANLKTSDKSNCLDADLIDASVIEFEGVSPRLHSSRHRQSVSEIRQRGAQAQVEWSVRH